MAKSFLKLDKRRALTDGTYPIKIAVGYGTNIYLSTDINVPEDEWDEHTQMCIGKRARQYNNVLSAMLTRLNSRILELKENGQFYSLSKTELKEMIMDHSLDAPSKEQPPTLGEMLDKVIATKGKRSAELFTATKAKLQSYTDIYKVNFEQITKMWLLEFYNHMGALSVNTKSIHMRNLRNVINFAIDENITQFYAFRNFRIPSEETPKRSLPLDKMRAFISCGHLTPFDTEYRDMFLLMFYLIGINIADLAALTRENVIDGRIEYRRAKTGKLYSIKIEPEAAEILRKYKGEKHLLRCFDRYKDYKGYAYRLNLALRGIGPVVMEDGKVKLSANHYPLMNAIEPKVTTYWARYSWATYAAELDIPKDTISESLGHEYGSKITGVYIKFSRDKIDAANRKVIDWVVKGIK